MTDHPAYPAAPIRRRRDPAATAPKIADADRPDPAELARARELAGKRRRFPVWKKD